jgi:competence protein ComEA
MMNVKFRSDQRKYRKFIRKMILAAAGGLFVLLCGCSRTEVGETIFIEGVRTPETKEALGREEKGVYDDPVGGTFTQRQVDSCAGEEASSEMEKELLIRVYVCGAVADPCVVSLPLGSRVEDAVLLAGGFDMEAATDAVNLADWITDGQMLYIPTRAEAEEGKNGKDRQGQYAEAWGHGFGSDAGNREDSLVNINTADVAVLVTLPGIGESRARDIVAYREKNGPFVQCQDIMKVSGIKTSIYEKICGKITVK